MNWQVAYLRALGIKPTAAAVTRLTQWQRWEGGSTANTAKNNYMNTKQSMPGSWDAIGNGVQGYKTLAQGAQAFAATLRNGHYPNLAGWIATGQGDPSRDLQVWVAGPGGVGSPSAVAYAQKVLGGRGADAGGATPSAPVQSQAAPAMSGETFDPQTAVRQQAAQGFADIAQGRAKPTDTLAPLLATLKTAGAQTQPAAPTAPPAVNIKSTGLEGQAANLVHKYLGIKYTWGGEDPSTGFDCSGLVQYVWKTLGVQVPRTSQEQWHAGLPVTKLRKGDAVFFVGSDGTKDNPGHEGMYIGDGLFIEAPHTGAEVRVSKLAGRTDYVGARRFA